LREQVRACLYQSRASSGGGAERAIYRTGFLHFKPTDCRP
jgi:hypothetical protein